VIDFLTIYAWMTSGIEGFMTIGTLLFSIFKGRQIGKDEFGNRYFEARSANETLHGRQRRWVLYNGTPDASSVPAEWHAWLHHMFDKPLTEQAARSNFWQKKHQKNLTGTSEAYRPAGHVFSQNHDSKKLRDYVPWSPE